MQSICYTLCEVTFSERTCGNCRDDVHSSRALSKINVWMAGGRRCTNALNRHYNYTRKYATVGQLRVIYEPQCTYVRGTRALQQVAALRQQN